MKFKWLDSDPVASTVYGVLTLEKYSNNFYRPAARSTFSPGDSVIRLVLLKASDGRF